MAEVATTSTAAFHPILEANCVIVIPLRGPRRPTPTCHHTNGVPKPREPSLFGGRTVAFRSSEAVQHYGIPNDGEGERQKTKRMRASTALPEERGQGL